MLCFFSLETDLISMRCFLERAEFPGLVPLSTATNRQDVPDVTTAPKTHCGFTGGHSTRASAS